MVEKNKKELEDQYIRIIINLTKNNHKLKNQINNLLHTEEQKKYFILNKIIKEMFNENTPMWIIKTITSLNNKKVAEEVLKLINE